MSSEDYTTLFTMVQSMSERLDILEEENRELKQLLGKNCNSLKRKAVNMIDTLPIPQISFEKWAENTLSLVGSHLNTVFQEDLLSGINSVINCSIDQCADLPIAVFDRKPNNYYCYENDNWKPLEISVLNHFIGRIAYRFLVEFKTCWYTPNIKNIQEKDEYKTMYNSYYMNILGGNRMTDESRNQRVRHSLYLLIKQKFVEQ
jgi:hypothetical protein